MPNNDIIKDREQEPGRRSGWVELTNGKAAREGLVARILIDLARMISEEGAIGEMKLALLRRLASGSAGPDPDNPFIIRLTENHFLNAEGRFRDPEIGYIVDAALQENPDRSIPPDAPHRQLLQQMSKYVIISPYMHRRDELRGNRLINGHMDRLKSCIHRRDEQGLAGHFQ